jgi:hypothetical protein
MNKPTIDIERVVREVLAKLGAAQENAPLPPGQGQGEGGADLIVSGRVVTMTEVAGRLESVRRLVVLKQAVVTPAVREELLRREIALVRADSAGKCPAAGVRLLMIVSGTDFDTAGLIAALAREGFDVERSALDCLIAATEQLADELAKPNTLGVLLTAHLAAALCLANRLQGVRAITGTDARAAAGAAAAVGANLLVTDPRAGTFFQLKLMIAEFCRGGVRACPAVFRTKLG